MYVHMYVCIYSLIHVCMHVSIYLLPWWRLLWFFWAKVSPFGSAQQWTVIPLLNTSCCLGSCGDSSLQPWAALLGWDVLRETFCLRPLEHPFVCLLGVWESRPETLDRTCCFLEGEVCPASQAHLEAWILLPQSPNSGMTSVLHPCWFWCAAFWFSLVC
jgi:hypothetical protein